MERKGRCKGRHPQSGSHNGRKVSLKYMSNFKRKLKKISLVLMALMMVVCAEHIPAKAASLDGMMIYGMYLDTKDKGDSVLIKSANEYILMDLGMYSNVPLICNQLD